MSSTRFRLFAFLWLSPFIVKAQCPTLADFLDGGTFNVGGLCVIDAAGAGPTTGAINFTGDLTLTNVGNFVIASDITYSGGILNVSGPGRLEIGDGSTGSFTIQSGAVYVNDGNSGTITVNANSDLSIASGASITSYNLIAVNGSGEISNAGTIALSSATGSMTISGTLNNLNTGTINVPGQMDVSGIVSSANTITVGLGLNIYGDLTTSGDIICLQDITVYPNGNLLVQSTGSLSCDNFFVAALGEATVAASGQITTTENDDNTIEGILTTSGILSFEGDLVVTGSAAIVSMNGGTIEITRDTDGDLEVTGNAQFIMSAGTLTVPDDITTWVDGSDSRSAGNISLNGTVNLTDDILITGGSFTSTATISANKIEVDGGSFNNNGIINIATDFVVTGGSVENDGTLNVVDDILISGGTFFNDEAIVLDDIIVSGTGLLRSHEVGATIFIGDQYADIAANCPAPSGAYHFCSCIGNSPDNRMCASALPIELLAFSGTQNGNAIQLSWTTATETNNDFFTIEKLTAADQIQEVISLPGAGTTVTKQEYSTSDPNPVIGKNYYRLKQTDYDRKTSYSEVIKVIFQSNSFVYNIFPNPLDGENLTVTASGLQVYQNIKVELRNGLGKVMSSEIASADIAGNLEIQMQLRNITSGVYYISVDGKTKKLIVR
jgi:hypothetical protein